MKWSESNFSKKTHAHTKFNFSLVLFKVNSKYYLIEYPISCNKNLSKYQISVGICLWYSWIFLRLHIVICQKKVTPLPTMGSRVYQFITWDRIYWSSCRVILHNDTLQLNSRSQHRCMNSQETKVKHERLYYGALYVKIINNKYPFQPTLFWYSFYFRVNPLLFLSKCNAIM